MKKVGAVVLGKSFFSGMLSCCNDFGAQSAEFAIVQDGEDFRLLSRIERAPDGAKIVADFSRCADEVEPESAVTPSEEPADPTVEEPTEPVSEPINPIDMVPLSSDSKPIKAAKKAAPVAGDKNG